MELASANLENIASQRNAAGATKFIDTADCAVAGRGGHLSKRRDVAQHLTITLDDWAMTKGLWSSVPSSRLRIEPPLMVAADQVVAVQIALSEESSLVRATARERTQFPPRPQQHEIDALKRHRVRSRTTNVGRERHALHSRRRRAHLSPASVLFGSRIVVIMSLPGCRTII